MNKGYSHGGSGCDDGNGTRGGADGAQHASSSFYERCAFCGWLVRGDELRRGSAGMACFACDRGVCPRCHEGTDADRSAFCDACLDALGYLRLVEDSMCQVLRLRLGDGSTVIGMFVSIFLHEGQVKITLHVPRELDDDSDVGSHINWDRVFVPLSQVRSVERYEPLLEEEETVSIEEMRRIRSWVKEDRKMAALEKAAHMPERVSSSPWADEDWDEDEDEDEGWDENAEYHDDILDEHLEARVEAVRKESKRLDILLDKRLKRLKGSGEGQAHNEIDRLLDLSMEVDDAVILLLNTLMAEFEEEDKRRERGECLTRGQARTKLLKVHGLISEAEGLLTQLRALLDGWILSR